MKKIKVSPYRHTETYRGISFHITGKGYALFGSYMPPMCDRRIKHWDDLLNAEERAAAMNHDSPDSEKIEIMRLVIDRALEMMA